MAEEFEWAFVQDMPKLDLICKGLGSIALAIVKVISTGEDYEEAVRLGKSSDELDGSKIAGWLNQNFEWQDAYQDGTHLGRLKTLAFIVGSYFENYPRRRPPSDDQVRLAAHALWERRGGTHGDDLKDWFDAKKSLLK